MLLKEHKFNILDDRYSINVDKIIPYWIIYIKDDEIIKGFDMCHLLDLHKDLHYYKNDKEKKEKQIEDLVKFKNNYKR